MRSLQHRRFGCVLRCWGKPQPEAVRRALITFAQSSAAKHRHPTRARAQRERLSGTGCLTYSGGSYSKSFHFIGRRKGSMRRMTSPFWKMRTVPLDSLTTTATLLVLRVIAAAAQ